MDQSRYRGLAAGADIGRGPGDGAGRRQFRQGLALDPYDGLVGFSGVVAACLGMKELLLPVDRPVEAFGGQTGRQIVENAVDHRGIARAAFEARHMLVDLLHRAIELFRKQPGGGEGEMGRGNVPTRLAPHHDDEVVLNEHAGAEQRGQRFV